MSNIGKAVEVLGGAASAARSLKVSPQAVSFWLSGDRLPSAENCIAIERETAGAVTVEQLRPDIDWQVVRRGTAA